VRPRRRAVKQDPPLPIVVELGEGVPATPELAAAISAEVRATLTFTPEVKLVPAQSLPRSEYKSKLVNFSDAKP
jgi:phenylacetate-CoA ligase